MTTAEIQKLNQKFNKFGYFIIGENAAGVTVQFVDDNGDLRTETATLDQLEAAYPVLQKKFDENCAVLGLEPAAIGISSIETKLLDAGRYAIDKLLNNAENEAANSEVDAAKANFLRMIQATNEILPREIANDLTTEIFCRLRLSYGGIATSWLTA